MKKTGSLLLLALVMTIFSHPAHGETSYSLAEYFPVSEGNSWFFDRQQVAIIIGRENPYTSVSNNSREWIDAVEYHDSVGYLSNDSDGLRIVGMYDFEEKTYNDFNTVFSSGSVKVANGQVTLGDSVTSSSSAWGLVITSTLVAVEDVEVAAGSFTGALKFRISIDEEDGAYTENLWLAKGVGPVKMERVSGSQDSSGCFWTCGFFSTDWQQVEVTQSELTSYHAIADDDSSAYDAGYQAGKEANQAIFTRQTGTLIIPEVKDDKGNVARFILRTLDNTLFRLLGIQQ